MLVHKPGSWVMVGDNIPATISRVFLSENGVVYEVVWWDGRERYERCLWPHEIKPHPEADTLELGFLSQYENRTP